MLKVKKSKKNIIKASPKRSQKIVLKAKAVKKKAVKVSLVKVRGMKANVVKTSAKKAAPIIVKKPAIIKKAVKPVIKSEPKIIVKAEPEYVPIKVTFDAKRKLTAAGWTRLYMKKAISK